MAMSTKSSKKDQTFQRIPRPEEVSHFTHFLLAQLRWQHGKIVGSFDDFDRECAKYDSQLGVSDIVAMEPLMLDFFSRHAKGDKWVPFHAVLGVHELYIFTNIWKLHYLSEGEKYALACGFSGSRFPELYDEVIMCCFKENECSKEGREILDNPKHAFRRNGPVHIRFDEYRSRGGKLHTSAFSPRPIPTGAVGKEYTFYILERTRIFLEMGIKIYSNLIAPALLSNHQINWEEMDAEFQNTKWVGPTLSKMFLVSTHFCFPSLKLLAHGIEVGIGAQEAFKLFYPGIQPAKDFSMLTNRREILLHLFNHSFSSCGSSSSSYDDNNQQKAVLSEPRLNPMIKWCAEQAYTKYRSDGIALDTFCKELDLLTFQVNLCEWRKFRNHCDQRRVAKRNMDSESSPSTSSKKLSNKKIKKEKP
jgi:hypothetical protein